MRQTIPTNYPTDSVTMAPTDNHQVERALHHAATALASLAFIDQRTAQQIAPAAEAIANLCTLLYYQADTGAVAEDELHDALMRIRRTVVS